MKIGVLDIQGSVEEHFSALSRVKGTEAVFVKKAADLKGLSGLVLPGGESTTLSKLIDIFGLRKPIIDFARRGGRVYGTCAGAILLARRVYSVVDDGFGGMKEVLDKKVTPLGLIDIDVVRNAYGRQLDSFETEIEVDFDGEGSGSTKIPAVFIRAPKIARVGKGVEVLASYEGEPVLVRARVSGAAGRSGGGEVLAGAFHPEMTDNTEVYEKFFLA